MANNELLEEVMQKIENEPDSWFQGSWAKAFGYPSTDEPCRTAYCFAGHAAVMTGFPEPAVKIHNGTTGQYYWIDHWAWTDGDGVFVREYAQEKLELTPDQADYLFSGGNSKELLRMLIDAIKEDPEIEVEGLSEIVDKYIESLEAQASLDE